MSDQQFPESNGAASSPFPEVFMTPDSSQTTRRTRHVSARGAVTSPAVLRARQRDLGSLMQPATPIFSSPALLAAESYESEEDESSDVYCPTCDQPRFNGNGETKHVPCQAARQWQLYAKEQERTVAVSAEAGMSLVTQMDAVQKQLSALQEEFQSLSQRSEQISLERDHAVSNLVVAERQLEQLKDSNRLLQIKLDQAQQQQQQQQQLQSDSQSMESFESKSTRQKLSVVTQATQQRVEQLQDNIEKMALEKESALDELKELKLQWTRLQYDYDSLKKEYEEHLSIAPQSSPLADVEEWQKLKQRCADYDALLSDRDGLLEVVQALTHAHDQLRHECDAQQRQLDDLLMNQESHDWQRNYSIAQQNQLNDVKPLSDELRDAESHSHHRRRSQRMTRDLSDAAMAAAERVTSPVHRALTLPTGSKRTSWHSSQASASAVDILSSPLHLNESSLFPLLDKTEQFLYRLSQCDVVVLNRHLKRAFDMNSVAAMSHTLLGSIRIDCDEAFKESCQNPVELRIKEILKMLLSECIAMRGTLTDYALTYVQKVSSVAKEEKVTPNVDAVHSSSRKSTASRSNVDCSLM